MIIGRSGFIGKVNLEKIGNHYDVILENIVKAVSDYITNNGIKAMVIGLSGGLDSTVSCAVCKIVSEKTGVPVYGISLPASTNKDNEKYGADLAGKEFCDSYSVNNIQEAYEAVSHMCSKSVSNGPNGVSEGNIKARLRMIALYDMASKLGGIVIDNDMLTEHFLSFFTVNGDVNDISPLANLWKSEVYGLARYMVENVFKDSPALKAAIEITPTDGNGVSSSDMDQIMPGFTYDDVDKILKVWVPLDQRIKESILASGVSGKSYGLKQLVEKYGVENVMQVIKRNVNGAFKRLPHPIPVDCFRGVIETVRVEE